MAMLTTTKLFAKAMHTQRGTGARTVLLVGPAEGNVCVCTLYFCYIHGVYEPGKVDCTALLIVPRPPSLQLRPAVDCYRLTGSNFRWVFQN